MKKVKYCIDSDSEDDVTVLIEDGGIATCHNNDEHMITTYYHTRCKRSDIGNNNILGTVSQGEASIKDWPEKQVWDNEVIQDMLEWLYMSSVPFEFEKANIDWTDKKALKSFVKEYDEEELREKYLGKEVTVPINPHPMGVGSSKSTVTGICKYIGYNPNLPDWDLQITVDTLPVTNIDPKTILLTNYNKDALQDKSKINEC